MELTPTQRRFFISGSLGILFGFVCAYFASGNMWTEFWWSALMWTIVTNRMVLGMFVWCAWAYKRHPIFWFKLNTFIRWWTIGAFTSLPLAIGSMITPIEGMSSWSLFWATMMAGVIYGMIIDFCATKWGWEGKKLLES